VEALANAVALIGRRWQLGRAQPSAVPVGEIREGPPDIDPDHIRRIHRQNRDMQVDPTPNPNAVKFTIGQPVGGPATFVPSQPTDNEMAAGLLALPGVTSVFLTADFVTVSKTADADWGDIIPAATEILRAHFG
jgi:hypothetical protein